MNPISHEHPDVSGGQVRAATFGAMDGLVTNISLVAGVGGAGASAHTIILSGVAGLIAGAIRHFGDGDDPPPASPSVAGADETVAANAANADGTAARSFDDAVAKLRSDFERSQEKLRK